MSAVAKEAVAAAAPTPTLPQRRRGLHSLSLWERAGVRARGLGASKA